MNAVSDKAKQYIKDNVPLCKGCGRVRLIAYRRRMLGLCKTCENSD